MVKNKSDLTSFFSDFFLKMKNKRVKNLVKLWCHMNNICIVKKMKILINNQALLNYILAINFETSKTLRPKHTS